MSWRDLGLQNKRLRKTPGLTSEELGSETGLSRIFIQKVECGERLPSLPPLRRIARTLGATLHVELVVERKTRRTRRG
jgi:transcriptional regulator with XRE-family HTH domain